MPPAHLSASPVTLNRVPAPLRLCRLELLAVVSARWDRSDAGRWGLRGLGLSLADWKEQARSPLEPAGS